MSERASWAFVIIKPVQVHLVFTSIFRLNSQCQSSCVQKYKWYTLNDIDLSHITNMQACNLGSTKTSTNAHTLGENKYVLHLSAYRRSKWNCTWVNLMKPVKKISPWFQPHLKSSLQTSWSSLGLLAKLQPPFLFCSLPVSLTHTDTHTIINTTTSPPSRPLENHFFKKYNNRSTMTFPHRQDREHLTPPFHHPKAANNFRSANQTLTYCITQGQDK